MKKIAAVGAALVMSAGIITGVPINGENASLFAVTAEAADNGFIIETDENGDKYVSGYNGSDENVTVPDGVKYIKEYSLMYKTFKSITFPKSCTKIKDGALYGCEHLKKVVFNGDVEFDTFAFISCIRLDNVTINGSIKGKIGDYAFMDCRKLKQFKIVQNKYDFKIGENAFADCNILEVVNIPSKCTSISKNAFENSGSVTIVVEENSFAEKWAKENKIKYAYVGNEPTVSKTVEIDTNAVEVIDGFEIKTDEDGYKYVSEYKGNGGNIKIPDGVNYVLNEIFKGNNNITDVTFPKSCDVIGKSVFENCASLKTVVFNGDAVILDEAFCKCASLESVTIKGSLRERFYGYLGGFGIGYSTFSECTSLKTVKIEKDEYEFSIENGAFSGCMSLTSINIPSKCTSIGYMAFLNCYNLSQLTIPSKTECGGYAGTDGNHPDIQQYCFGCVNLYEKQTIKRGGKYIEEYTNNKIIVADGKTSGYYQYRDNWEDNFEWKYVKVTPKQLTVYVTKGSPAEKYCKENGIKYAYGNAPAVTTQPKTTTPPAPAAAPKLAAPTGIKGTASSDKIVLTWNKVNGAEGYRIYKYDEKSGKYLKYKDVKNEKCTVKGLKSGTKYKFKIYALVSENGKFALQTPTNAFSFTTKSGKKADEPFDDTLITL